MKSDSEILVELAYQLQTGTLKNNFALRDRLLYIANKIEDPKKRKKEYFKR